MERRYVKFLEGLYDYMYFDMDYDSFEAHLLEAGDYSYTSLFGGFTSWSDKELEFVLAENSDLQDYESSGDFFYLLENRPFIFFENVRHGTKLEIF